MDKYQRLTLKNQFAILELLARANPKVATRGTTTYHAPDRYQWYQEILTCGYDVLYPEFMQDIYDVELTSTEQDNILDILNMYTHLQQSFESLTDKCGLEEANVDFDGWDGHGSELGFAQTYCYRTDFGVIATKRNPDRFATIKPSPAFDSHMPTTDVYNRMLHAYSPIKKVCYDTGWRSMTVEEIRTVLDARTHPDYRGQ